MVKRLSLALAVLALAAAPCTAAPSDGTPEALAGTWDLSLDRTGTSCRVMLRADKADSGDYFLGMSPACRHAMPALAAVGRWARPDAQHLVLADPAGARILALTSGGDTYSATVEAGIYRMKPIALTGRSAAAFEPVDVSPSAGFAQVELVASRHHRVDEAAAEPESVADTAGRYAVMREKRDTGCMITLDSARIAGGARAQLAPGCRDQGIVVFDPSSWQIVKGELVLTARAGHKAHLAKESEGLWTKDTKDGGKPLGLKKL